MKAWRGVIEEYRDFLPVSDKTPIVTLHEGDTPLVPAPRLAEATDGVYQVEGDGWYAADGRRLLQEY